VLKKGRERSVLSHSFNQAAKSEARARTLNASSISSDFNGLLPLTTVKPPALNVRDERKIKQLVAKHNKLNKRKQPPAFDLR
jgi:hypothetical protein